MRLFRGQEVDDGFPVVRTTGAADLMKLRMQQLLESLTTATNPGLMEFDFEGLKFLKEG